MKDQQTIQKQAERIQQLEELLGRACGELADAVDFFSTFDSMPESFGCTCGYQWDEQDNCTCMDSGQHIRIAIKEELVDEISEFFKNSRTDES